MPLPPPPAAALIATGYPISAAIRAASSALSTGSVTPGTIGTPAAAITCRALVFDAMASIASGGGPMKVTPAAAQARANPEFSARNPKPGWMASAPARVATSTITSPCR